MAWYKTTPMDPEFEDDDLRRLEEDPSFTTGLPQAIVKAFRKRMQQIRSAPDERDFYALKGMRFEKLKGQRKHEHSMRLNDQFRLIVKFKGGNPNKTIVIVAIEDYHH